LNGKIKMILYRVYSKKYDVYSKGGIYCFPRDNEAPLKRGWSKKGKVWNSFSHLKLHFRMYENAMGRLHARGEDIEIIENDLINGIETRMTLNVFIETFMGS